MTSNKIQKEPAAKPAPKVGIDIVRLATLAGVLALLAISFVTLRSMDQIQTGLESRISQIEDRLADVSKKIDTAAVRNMPARRGPDPNRVYAVNTVGAPAKGPANALINIVEFSDFQ